MSSEMNEITLEDQICILQDRIRELEDQIQSLRERDVPYSDQSNNMMANMGRSEEQYEELKNILEYWMFRIHSASEIMKRIEEAPIKMRDKMIMVFLFARGMRGDDGPGGGGIEIQGGLVNLSELFQQLMSSNMRTPQAQERKRKRAL